MMLEPNTSRRCSRSPLSPLKPAKRKHTYQNSKSSVSAQVKMELIFMNIITYKPKVILENVCGMFPTTSYVFGLHVRLTISLRD